MAKKKNSIKKEKIIEVLQQIPEKDLRSFLEKIICRPVVKARFLKEFDAYFINKKSADVYIEQIIGVFHDSKEEYGCISFNKQSELSGKIPVIKSHAAYVFCSVHQVYAVPLPQSDGYALLSHETSVPLLPACAADFRQDRTAV